MDQPVTKRKCHICQKSSDVRGVDILLYGAWQFKNDLTVHYYCLLLSTNLPQRGVDNCGILGFLIGDIRKEIKEASKRVCVFCSKNYATIKCHTCKDYFHLICGERNMCLFQFCNEFYSYCKECTPLDNKHRKNIEDKPSSDTRCYICKDTMGSYSPLKWIHATCCGNGYAHRICLQEYALSAGYYLKCIWCKDANFRNYIRTRGVFVPDRDAQWEREIGAFRDLHHGHLRCDMPKCLCPRGRDYIYNKWSLIVCSLCGSFGAHNPTCIPGKEKSKTRVTEFKCDTCANTEKSLVLKQIGKVTSQSNCNTTLYVEKVSTETNITQVAETLEFSSSESLSSSTSCATTVIPQRTPLQSEKVNPQNTTTVDSLTNYSKLNIIISDSSEELSEYERELPETCARTTNFEYLRNLLRAKLVTEPVNKQTNESNPPEQLKEHNINQLLTEQFTNSQPNEININKETNEKMAQNQPIQEKRNESAAEINTTAQLAEHNITTQLLEESKTNNQPSENTNSPEVAKNTIEAIDCDLSLPDTEPFVQNNDIQETISISTPEISSSTPDNEDEALRETQIIQENETEATQSNIVSTSQNLEEDFVYFDMFEIDEDKMECLRRMRVCIDLSEPRFANKSLELIKATPGLVTYDDIVEIYDDIGIFKDINEIIAEYM